MCRDSGILIALSTAVYYTGKPTHTPSLPHSLNHSLTHALAHSQIRVYSTVAGAGVRPPGGAAPHRRAAGRPGPRLCRGRGVGHGLPHARPGLEPPHGAAAHRHLLPPAGAPLSRPKFMSSGAVPQQCVVSWVVHSRNGVVRSSESLSNAIFCILQIFLGLS